MRQKKKVARSLLHTSTNVRATSVYSGAIILGGALPLLLSHSLSPPPRSPSLTLSLSSFRVSLSPPIPIIPIIRVPIIHVPIYRWIDLLCDLGFDPAAIQLDPTLSKMLSCPLAVRLSALVNRLFIGVNRLLDDAVLPTRRKTLSSC